MIARATVALACVVVVAALAVGTAAAAGASTRADACTSCFERRVERIGTTAQGRPITVVARGRRDADIDVLVVSGIHGNERGGGPIVRQLQRELPPRRVRWWLVAGLNVDGMRRDTRQNARGVDLNRNFPFDWRGGGRPFDTFYPGPRAASEPETRAVLGLVRRVRPDLTLWYHQHARLVDQPSGAWRVALARIYARWSQLPLRSGVFGRLHGTATSWQHHEQPRSAAFVVELPAGTPGATAVARHLVAIRRTSIAAAHDDVRSP